MILLIPLALSIIAVYRPWDMNYTVLKWAIIGVTILAWLVNEAVKNSRKMELKGKGDRKVTYFWVKVSMFMFVVNCIVAIYGLVKTF